MQLPQTGPRTSGIALQTFQVTDDLTPIHLPLPGLRELDSIAAIIHDAKADVPGSSTTRPVWCSYASSLNASGAQVIG